jgi:citrate synthase
LTPRQLASLRASAKDALVRMQMALPFAGATDLAGYDLRPPAVRQTGARILRLLTAIVGGGASQAPVHAALQAAWVRHNKAAGEAIRMALVLCADHELNVSAFTARCSASAGASPYDIVSAAMATLRGRRHGGETERVAALFAEMQTARSARTVMADRLRRGEVLPGFGHPLYPAGDPRAALLLELAAAGNDGEQWKKARALSAAAWELLRERPNLDFGLVALARAHGLPEHAPLVLFAVGRTTGWIAHAIEQYQSGELIRPRAGYRGPVPE